MRRVVLLVFLQLAWSTGNSLAVWLVSWTFLLSVFTPYYTEEVLFSSDDLDKENEDGVSILFYLQKIYPGLFVNLEFQNVLHMIYC